MNHKVHEDLISHLVDIDTLNLDPKNARQHDKPNIDAIKRSLDQFQQRKPVVVQKQGMIVRAGNGMVVAAKELGWTKIAAVVVDDTDLEAQAFALADNKTAELSMWDDDVLAQVLQDIQENAEELIETTGFSDEEIRELLAEFDAVGMPGLPDGDREAFQQMTFTVSDEQAESVKGALKKAMGAGSFVDTGNENSNGNALARIAELYLGQG